MSSVPNTNAVDANLWNIIEGPFFPYVMRDAADSVSVFSLFDCERLIIAQPIGPTAARGPAYTGVTVAIVAIALLRVEGLPIESAARRAGTTTGALRVRAHRAYKVLRQLL